MRKKDLNNHCDEAGGKLMPIVNFNSCAAKRDCVEVCPFDVFEMRPITKEDKAQLNLKGKIKTFFFSNKAYIKNPEACHACGLCIPACPESAIKLTKYVNGNE